MEKYIPKKGEIVDIGCGEGVFSIYLSLKSKSRQVYGIDTSSQRLKIAKRAGKGLLNLQFCLTDALAWKQKVDVIIVSDVFHHFSKINQEEFLNRSYKLLNDNGCLIIKEINKNDFIRAKLSRLWDFLLYPEDKINYWSKEEFKQRLSGLKFNVTVKREMIFFPGSTVLYIAKK